MGQKSADQYCRYYLFIKKPGYIMNYSDFALDSRAILKEESLLLEVHLLHVSVSEVAPDLSL